MVEQKLFYVFTDGGARGNPGPAAVGVVIKNQTGKVLTSFGRYIGRATNNSAEYQAVVEALSFLEKNYLERKAAVVKINFYLDSTLVVNQLNGRFKIKDQKLKNLIIKVKALEEKIKGKIFYHFIPREKNRQADLLVNQTLNQKNF